MDASYTDVFENKGSEISPERQGFYQTWDWVGVIRETLLPAKYLPDTEEDILKLKTYIVFDYLRYLDQKSDMLEKESDRLQKEAEQKSKTKNKSS